MSQFGQPPLAAYLPLRAGQNLSDLPDKTAALANLGTLSTSDIMLNSVPIGTIIPFWGNTAPVGYLPCNGQTVNSSTFPDLVTFLGGTTSAVVPDLRGEFLRGWDNGRGVDTGRANLSSQNGSGLRSITSNGASGSTGNNWINTEFDAISSATYNYAATGASTVSVQTGIVRPRNIAVLYCMKAYGALINTSTANMGNVLTELSQCTKLTQFGSNIVTGPGYQKLPTGLIIQWGALLSSTSTATATYPIAFPTAVLSKSVAMNDKTSGSSLLQLYLTSALNNLTTIGANMAGYDSGTWSAQWIAIGY